MVHYSTCPLCHSEDINLKLKSSDHFLTKEEFDIFECKSCRFVFTQDHPEESEAARYYESDEYISHTGSGKGLINRIYGVARTLMLARKKCLINKYTHLEKGTILDIGSGAGYFAATMKKAGWEVSAIEINEKARIMSGNKFEISVSDPAEISKLKTAGFDAITLWHVLEHFHDPFTYASEIYRLLKPGAVCFVALPNSQSHDALHYKSEWAAYDLPRHLWHFSPDTFMIFAKKAGLVTEKTIPLPLDVFYISPISERYKGGSFSFIKGLIMAKWFFFLSVFDNRYSSLIYVLRKPLS